MFALHFKGNSDTISGKRSKMIQAALVKLIWLIFTFILKTRAVIFPEVYKKASCRLLMISQLKAGLFAPLKSVKISPN